MDKIVYFYAVLGDLNEPAFAHGGGEVGNRRTLSLLESLGYKVVPIPKYPRTIGLSAYRRICNMCQNLWLFWRTLYNGDRNNGIVHVTGFSGPIVYWFFIIVLIAKLLRYKLVYEIRGGNVVERYYKKTSFYRWCFRRSICMSDCIFSQGEINKDLILKIKPEADFYYYPNYVEKGFSPETPPSKPEASLNLIYFGRLSHKKHIDVIIDVFNGVSASVPVCTTLTIIGEPENDKYAEFVQENIEKSEYKDHITLLPRSSHDLLKTYLPDKHFYIFPTKEDMEGHSNALTEAMSWGIIPIATNHGYNKHVISCDDLIVSEISKESIVKIILKLYKEDTISQYSQNIFSRSKELYSYEAAITRLAAKYDKLFNTLLNI